MRVLLTGGTGFIGRHLVRALAERGDQCIVVSRSPESRWPARDVVMVRGDTTESGAWQEHVSGCDAIINLAGERIVDPLHPWTAKRKALIVSSRVTTTQNVVAAIRNAPNPPPQFLSGSAVGYYGSAGDAIVDESAPAGSDFLATLCVEWESAATEADGVSEVTLLRSGLVMGLDGAPLANLLPPFRLGLGGPWGTGRQWWSWIHIADEVRLILFALDRKLGGPLNLTSPNPVTVAAFARALGRAVRRPAFFKLPATALRLALGEASMGLLDLQRVIPARAQAEGYQFQHPEIEEALREIVEG